jgi:hypothetical protein
MFCKLFIVSYLTTTGVVRMDTAEPACRFYLGARRARVNSMYPVPSACLECRGTLGPSLRLILLEARF